MEEYEPEFTITITYDNFLTRSENFFYSTSIVPIVQMAARSPRRTVRFIMSEVETPWNSGHRIAERGRKSC
jgi:hypothetical protein